MPLGIVSDSEFDAERQNSDSLHESNSPGENHLNNTKIDFEDSIKPSEETEEVKIPEIITSSQIAGRHEGIGNIPQSLRKVLADDVITNGVKSAQSLVSGLGMKVSQPTLNTYGNGETSPGSNTPASQDMFEYVNGRKAKITKKALNKINMALELIDSSKMAGLDARELTGIAKDMAVVVDKMQPAKKEETKKDPVQFIMMMPQMHQENHYETVVAKDAF